MKTPRKWLLFAENSPKGGGGAGKFSKFRGGLTQKGGARFFRGGLVPPCDTMGGNPIFAKSKGGEPTPINTMRIKGD